MTLYQLEMQGEHEKYVLIIIIKLRYIVEYLQLKETKKKLTDISLFTM